MSEPIFRLLLVEDDAGDARLAELALTSVRHGRFETRRAESLVAALECLETASFDAILLDLSLPDSDGFDSVRRVHEQAPRTPILVLTGLDAEEAAINALENGAHDYLVKGDMSRHALGRAVRYAAQRQQILQERETAIQALADAKQQLERKNRRLGELYETAHRFVDNVSHEFRTPLTVIQEYCAIIREGLVGEVNAEQRHFLDIAVDRVQDLNIMVNDMLDISRLEAGMLGVRRKECLVEQIFRKVETPLKQKADVKNVPIEIELPPGLPAVYCDLEKVSRVIINLTVNSIKFTPEAGQIKLWARLGDDPTEVLIGVSDNGPGIERDSLQAIFERFRQLGHNVRGSTKGFGLGLAIAKELVHLNLGEISVTSEPGAGSTFYFSVPLADPNVIAERYLQQRRRSPDCPDLVSLIAIEAEGIVDEAQCEEMDDILHNMLRRHDMLLRLKRSEWLLFANVDPAAWHLVTKRVEEAWAAANRNRPQEPLPPVRTSIQATHRLEPLLGASQESAVHSVPSLVTA